MKGGTAGVVRYDVAIVGAGLVGLATALRLLEEQPALRVVVLDKEDRVAAHQSSHNSGVIHAGVYYTPGSLKARLCLEGRKALEQFAERRGIPIDHCGKIIVAVDKTEFGRLDLLRGRALQNGAKGVADLGPAGIRDLEPSVVGLRGLHVPSTSIVDFERVAGAYRDEIAERGAEILLGRRVDQIAVRRTDQILRTTGDDLVASLVIVCAGLHADRLAPRGDLRIIPFRGAYQVLVPRARHLVRGLVYPVPDPALPFLGVHFTRRIDGEVWAGPNAVLAFAREGYRRRDLDVRDLADILGFAGFWRLGRAHWRTGVGEFWRDLVRRSFVRDLRRYIPEISRKDLAPGPAGVRAQAVRIDGSMIDDFSIIEEEGAIYVRNAPSPGATASLAIGQHLARLAAKRL